MYNGEGMQMALSLVKMTIDPPVGRVVLARPTLHNAFNDVMIQELDQCFQTLGQNAEVRVIVLAAEGKSFCAGADLNWMQSMLNYTFEENVADASRLSRMLQTIDTCPKPVLGRIHGAAFGGGVGLASVCDLTVALATASFSLSEVKLGLIPAVISPFVLQRILATHARRYFLTAERFSALEAYRIGLISAVAEAEAGLDETLQTWIQALCQNGPEAVSDCKQLIRDVCDATGDTRFAFTAERIAKRRIRPEGQEGMRAFLEKRSPSWITEEALHVP